MTSLISLANARVPMPVACRAAGLEVPDVYRDSGTKMHCPWGEFTHSDGGREKAFRIWPDHAWCVDMETEILSMRGWLTGDQLRETDVVLTYEDGGTQWQPLQAIHRLPAGPRRMLSMETKTHSSLTTGQHRWLVRTNNGQKSSKEVFRTSGTGFKTSDVIPYIGGPYRSRQVRESLLPDAFAELVGWFFTEGTIWQHRGCSPRILIYQSQRVNPENCARIREVLTKLLGPASRSLRGAAGYGGWRETTSANGKTEFALSTGSWVSARLLEVAPGRVVRPEFVTHLTHSQLEAFTSAAMAGDGTRIGNWSQLCQKDRDMLDSFQIAQLLLGRPARIWRRENSGTRLEGQEKAPDWACQMLNSQGFHPEYWRRKGAVHWVHHEGPVWCVTVPAGTWIARRKGTVYVTGNCFACKKRYGPVRLYALLQEVTYEQAAIKLLDAIGYRPVSVAHLWGAAIKETPPDTGALQVALRNYCASLAPGSALALPLPAAYLARCNGYLTQVKDEKSAEQWLKLAKTVMQRALTGATGAQ